MWWPRSRRRPEFHCPHSEDLTSFTRPQFLKVLPPPMCHKLVTNLGGHLRSRLSQAGLRKESGYSNWDLFIRWLHCTLSRSVPVLPGSMYYFYVSAKKKTVERDRQTKTVQTLDLSHRREHRKSQRHTDVWMQACVLEWTESLSFCFSEMGSYVDSAGLELSL